MEQDYKQISSFRKHLSIFYEKCIISIKASNEYKIDFWMMNIFDIFHLSGRIIFYSILGTLFVGILDWNMHDFILYWLFNLIAWKFLWLHHLRDFNRRLLIGELNIHLLRPANTYFLASSEMISGQNIISILYILPITFGIVLFYNYTNILFAILVMIFSSFYFMIFFNVLMSSSFFFKNAQLITDPLLKTNGVIFKFTPKLFEKLSIYNFFLLFPSSLQAFFIIEILKGRTSLFLEMLPLIILSFFIMIIILYLMWRYGLKRYEAFG